MMTIKKLSTTIKRAGARTLPLVLALAGLHLFSIPAPAHGGMEHLSGKLISVGESILSVKTTQGATVEVHLEAATEYVLGTQAAKKTDLRPGDRVVIHAAKKNGVLTARQVRLGARAQPAKKTK